MCAIIFVFNKGFLAEENHNIGSNPFYETLSKILCKWEQDSVISFFLYLDSVFKDKYKLVHNQSPV